MFNPLRRFKKVKMGQYISDWVSVDSFCYGRLKREKSFKMCGIRYFPRGQPD
jgi:hypothetical protein